MTSPHPSHPRLRLGATARCLLLALASGFATAGCAPELPPQPPTVAGAATPRPDQVEAVLFLVGDPGEAIPGRSPLLAQLGAEVESWASRLEPGAVRIAYLGDLVYPSGIRPSGDRRHAGDTLALHAQLRPILRGAGRERGAEILFIPGNHDWGNTIGTKGRARLAIMENRIQEWAAAGLRARMVPAGGTIGPVTIPLTEGIQIVVLDTQGWLGGTAAERSAAGSRLRTALGVEARTILLAHHPLRTGGNHGIRPLNDPLALPSRAGVIPQDLPSVAYGRMKREIEAAIAGSRRPLLAAAGHDHNLQLFRTPDSAGEPEWTLVSGSASKLTPVSAAEEMVFGGPWPGYGRLFVRSDGSVVLQVGATDPEWAACLQDDPAEVADCVRRGARAFRTIWSETIFDPADESPPGLRP